MIQAPTPQEIIPPDYALSARIEELSNGIRYSETMAIGTLAVGASGVTGAYLLLKGESNNPFVQYVGPGSGALSVGWWTVGLVGQSLSLREERRPLRRQERQNKVLAAQHYEENEGFYQTQALQDAIEADSNIKGWSL